jgi:hypothetical protein
MQGVRDRGLALWCACSRKKHGPQPIYATTVWYQSSMLPRSILADLFKTVGNVSHLEKMGAIAREKRRDKIVMNDFNKNYKNIHIVIVFAACHRRDAIAHGSDEFYSVKSVTVSGHDTKNATGLDVVVSVGRRAEI